MKTCPKCQIEKEEENFWKGTAYCKPCYNEWKRANRLKNITIIKEQRKNQWFKKESRDCLYCEKKFVGNGRKREFCSTKCKLLGNIKIKYDTQCWEWQDPKHPNGYAYTTIYEEQKKKHVHRISYEIFKGNIPEGLYVCHSCDNRICINPDHLWIGTAKENMQDAKNKGRLEHIKFIKSRGEKNPSSKLNNEKVKEIKKMLKDGIRPTEISRKFSVHSSCVYSIRDRKTWKHIE